MKKKKWILIVLLPFFGFGAFISLFVSLLPEDFQPEDLQGLKTEDIRIGQSFPSSGDPWWRQERERREQEIDRFLKDDHYGYYWYQYGPMGYSGIPFVMFRLFSEIFPDLWGDHYLEEVGLFKDEWRDKPVLPYGLTWGKSGIPLTTLPVLNKARVMIVSFSCAACHTGRVVGPDQKIRMVLGAPSTTFDINKYRHLVAKTVQDPRYQFESFKSALAKKSMGWLYGDNRYLAQEVLDTRVFLAKGELMLKAVKDKLLTDNRNIETYLGPVYGSASQLLEGNTPGALEPFTNVARNAPEGPDSAIRALFGPGPAIIDIMSVWNQKERKYAQWDGGIEHAIMRNLGAELALVGNAKYVNFKNAVVAANFLSNLPSPPYLWDVDKNKADQGKVIFQQVCSKCHGNQAFLPVSVVQTDGNRAYGATEGAVRMIRQGLKDSCPSGDPLCEATDQQIFKDIWKNPGYVAQKLDGIWARAPYFHNGSVPTLYHVLVPSERPTTFQRGNLNYDPEKVGFVYTKGGISTYDTGVSGYSNRGHEDIDQFFGGIDFKKDIEKREALLEYLKSL